MKVGILGNNREPARFRESPDCGVVSTNEVVSLDMRTNVDTGRESLGRFGPIDSRRAIVSRGYRSDEELTLPIGCVLQASADVLLGQF
jgi:hypothetical protein